MHALGRLLLLAAVAAALALAWVYGGGFNAAADAPHSAPVYWLLDTARLRSIEVRASGIEVPALDDPQKIAAGAAEYSQMCEGCHRAPGKPADEEFLGGLYPRPPDLSRSVNAKPAELFWVVKHGIKMSAMPAWGLSHNDATLWNIVAFVQKLPGLSAERYAALTAHAATAHDADHHAPADPDHGD